MPSPGDTSRDAPHVLIVDDDTDILDALAELLAAHAVRVETAPSGFAALETLQRNPLPSLVLLDIRMPGMSGWDVYTWMQRDPTTAGVPVVIISGEGQTPSEARARGVKEVLRKPIDLDAMLRLVERYCVRA